jgi:hypothetical protein
MTFHKNLSKVHKQCAEVVSPLSNVAQNMNKVKVGLKCGCSRINAVFRVLFFFFLNLRKDSKNTRKGSVKVLWHLK